jgi:hypothetical protein
MVTSPLQRTWASTPAVQVVAGSRHTCILTSAGTVHCWGANSVGEAGDGTIVTPRNPGQVRNPAGTGFLTGIVEIAASSSMTCARTASNATYCWGYGASLPRRVQTSTTDTTPVDFSAFLGEGNAFAAGVAGLTAGAPRFVTPIAVAGSTVFRQGAAFPTTGVVVDIAGSSGTEGAASAIACAIHEPGLQCYGVNTYGEVGDGTRSPRTSFTDVLPPL